MTAVDIQISASWAEHVVQLTSHDCWPWSGPLLENDYGRTKVKIDGRWRTAGAHQVAYYLATGRWERRSDGRMVRHLCHFRRCCNPKHLLGGTAQDNANDRGDRRLGIDLLAHTRLALPIAGVAW